MIFGVEQPPKITPNEKLIEMLFVGTVMRLYGARLAIQAPTTVREYLEGFDTAFHSGNCSRDLFIQFKRPDVRTTDYLNISVTEHQHHVLERRAPLTAYYVAATFFNEKELREALVQADATPLEFLRHFIAIEVTDLPSDVKAIRYLKHAKGNPNHGVLPNDPTGPYYRTIPKKRKWEPLCGLFSLPWEQDKDKWLRGDELIERFINGTVGWQLKGSSTTHNLPPTTTTEAVRKSPKRKKDFVNRPIDSLEDYTGWLRETLLPSERLFDEELTSEEVDLAAGRNASRKRTINDGFSGISLRWCGGS